MLYFFYVNSRRDVMYKTDSFEMFSIFHLNIIFYLAVSGWLFIMLSKKQTLSRKEK